MSEPIRPVGPEAPPAVMFRLHAWSPRDEQIEPDYERHGNGYRDGMRERELVDSTRAWWRINPWTVDQRGIHHAVAVRQGLTRGVMEITGWLEARDDGRRAFTAESLTSGAVWDAWVGREGRFVEFKRGAANPVIYWPMR